KYITQQKKAWKCKRNLYIRGMTLIKYRARAAKLINLFRKFTEIYAAFVEHTNIIIKRGGEAVFPKCHRKIRIFANAHFGEAAHLFESRFPHAHIKTTRLKFGYGFLVSANSARCKHRSHRVGDRLLHKVEAFMCFIGATKRVAWRGFKVILNVLDVIFLYHNI